MKKYEHQMSLNFYLVSENEFPTPQEVLKALENSYNGIDVDNVMSNIEFFSSEEVDNEEE